MERNPTSAASPDATLTPSIDPSPQVSATVVSDLLVTLAEVLDVFGRRCSELSSVAGWCLMASRAASDDYLASLTAHLADVASEARRSIAVDVDVRTHSESFGEIER